MKKSFNQTDKIRVDPKEIVFFQEHAPSSFVTLIRDGLKDQNIHVNRIQVNREISSIKKEYLKSVIVEARRLIKAIKGLEYIHETKL